MALLQAAYLRNGTVEGSAPLPIAAKASA